MCKIAYQASEDEGNSFYTNQKPSSPAIRSRAGEAFCAADYINIPHGSNDENGKGKCNGVGSISYYRVFFNEESKVNGQKSI